MSTTKNSVSLETLQNNSMKMNVIAYAILALILVGVGGSLASGGSGIGIGLGLLIAFVGGGSVGKMAYDMLVDPRNERKCDIRNLNRYSWMKIPDTYISGDANIDTAVDISERDALMKVIYEGYGGVYLKSNNAADSIGGNYDAWFIPGNATATLTTRKATQPVDNDGFADRLFLVKKGDNRVVAKDTTKNKTTISPIPIDGTSPPYFTVDGCDPVAPTTSSS